MTPRIVFNTIVPAEVRAMMSRYLPAVLPFVPTEYHELRIGWDAEDTNAGVKVKSVREYRWAVITVCPGFLNEPELERRQAVLHEVVHLIVHPLAAELDGLTDSTKDLLGERDEKHWRERRRLALETTVTDIARHLMQQIPEGAWDAPTYPNYAPNGGRTINFPGGETITVDR